LGGFAEESLSALKLIVSFNQEQKASDTYREKAVITRDIGKAADFRGAAVFGILRVLIFGFFLYALALATVFVEHEIENPRSGRVYDIAEIMAVT